LFNLALQIKYGELLLLFSLPSNVQFHSVLCEVMKLVIYLRGEENVLLCGKNKLIQKIALGLRNVYSSHSIGLIKCRWMKWVEHIARVVEIRNSSEFWSGNRRRDF